MCRIRVDKHRKRVEINVIYWKRERFSCYWNKKRRRKHIFLNIFVRNSAYSQRSECHCKHCTCLRNSKKKNRARKNSILLRCRFLCVSGSGVSVLFVSKHSACEIGDSTHWQNWHDTTFTILGASCRDYK